MELFVFILRFERRSAAERAFGVLSENESVDSCIVDPGELRIRFLARKQDGPPLLEKIYDRGGMVWCERYPVKKSEP